MMRRIARHPPLRTNWTMSTFSTSRSVVAAGISAVLFLGACGKSPNAKSLPDNPAKNSSADTSADDCSDVSQGDIESCGFRVLT